MLPNSAKSKQVDNALRNDFPPGGTSPLHAALTEPSSRGRDVRAYAERLAARPAVAEIDPPRVVGRDTWLISVVPASGAKPTLDLVRAVRAGPPGPGLGPLRVAGESARFVDQRAGLADRLPFAVAVLAITTLVILFAMTGSVVLPIKALVMNVLGLSAAFGLLVFVFRTVAWRACSTTRARAAWRSPSRSCCWRSRSA